MKCLLIFALLAGTAWGGGPVYHFVCDGPVVDNSLACRESEITWKNDGDLYSPDPDEINRNIIIKAQQHVGDSYQNVTDKTWHLYNGERWLTCGPSFGTGNCWSVNKEEWSRCDAGAILELQAAAEGVLGYLEAPSDPSYEFFTSLPYHSLPNELEKAEMEVERLKKKDAAIKRFREALEKAK